MLKRWKEEAIWKEYPENILVDYSWHRHIWCGGLWPGRKCTKQRRIIQMNSSACKEGSKITCEKKVTYSDKCKTS